MLRCGQAGQPSASAHATEADAHCDAFCLATAKLVGKRQLLERHCGRSDASAHNKAPEPTPTSAQTTPRSNNGNAKLFDQCF